MLWIGRRRGGRSGIGYVANHLKYVVGLPGYSFWQTLHLASPKMKFYDPTPEQRDLVRALRYVDRREPANFAHVP